VNNTIIVQILQKLQAVYEYA